MAPLSLTTTGGSNGGASSTGSPAAGTVGGIGLTERTLGHLSHHLAGSTGSGSFTDHMVNPSLTNLGNLEASVTESASTASLPPFLRNLVTGNLTAAAVAASGGSLASVTTTGTIGGGGSRQFSNASPPSHRSQSPTRNSLGGGANLQGSPFVSLSHSSSSSKRRKYSLDQDIEQEDRDDSRWRRRPRYPQHLVSANATAYDEEEGHAFDDDDEEMDDEDDMDDDSLEQVQDLSTRRASSHSRLLTSNITNSSLATTLHRGISDPGTVGAFRRNKGDQSNTCNGKGNNDHFTPVALAVAVGGGGGVGGVGGSGNGASVAVATGNGGDGDDEELEGNDEENAIACSTDSLDEGNSSGDQNELDRVNKFTPCLDEDGHGGRRVASCTSSDEQVTSNNKLQANSKDIEVDSNNSLAASSCIGSNVASNEACHEKSVNANANGLIRRDGGEDDDEEEDEEEEEEDDDDEGEKKKNLLFCSTTTTTTIDGDNKNKGTIEETVNANTVIDLDAEAVADVDDDGQNGIVGDDEDDPCDDEDEDASSNNATSNTACVTTNTARNRRRSKRGRKKFTHDKK